MINGIATAYSELNAFILNHNGNHKFSPRDVSTIVVDDVVVTVIDHTGIPVQDATVEVYGMKTNAFQERYAEPQPLLQTLKTNSQGKVSVSKPAKTQTQIVNPNSGIEYLVKAVKVSKNGKSTGAYYSTLDLQYAGLIENKDIYEITLVLR